MRGVGRVLLLALAGLVIIGPLLMLVPFAIYYLVTGANLADSMTALVDTADVTPASLAYLNLSLAAALPEDRSRLVLGGADRAGHRNSASTGTR